jgi:hypothetical protein
MGVFFQHNFGIEHWDRCRLFGISDIACFTTFFIGKPHPNRKRVHHCKLGCQIVPVPHRFRCIDPKKYLKDHRRGEIRSALANGAKSERLCVVEGHRSASLCRIDE